MCFLTTMEKETNARTLYIPYCLYNRRGCSKSKPDYSSSPYSSGDINQSWPTGITPIPRASTNWDAAPPIEMAEGGSTRVLVDKKHQTNGLVSYRMFLCRLLSPEVLVTNPLTQSLT